MLQKEIIEIFEKIFIKPDYLNSYLKYNEWNIENFLKIYLRWSDGVDIALKYFGLTGEEHELRKGLIELEPITANDKVYCKDKIGAALLRVKGVKDQI